MCFGEAFYCHAVPRKVTASNPLLSLNTAHIARGLLVVDSHVTDHSIPSTAVYTQFYNRIYV